MRTGETPAAPVQALLRRERKRFVGYWSLLQEMRLRGELPDWIRTAFVTAGSHEDYDAASAEQTETDLALLGRPVRPRYSLGVDNDGTAFLHSQDGHMLYAGLPSKLPVDFPDALFEFTAAQMQMFVQALCVEINQSHQQA